MSYAIGLEDFVATYAELEPMYRAHYDEMRSRLKRDGIEIGPYNPRLDEYCRASAGGWLLHFVARTDGRAVGYSNVYVTQDMHNGETIAQEDTIYVTPAHRNGLGRRMTRHILAELKRRGCKRATMTAVTDTRAAPVWKRMGFKPTAEILTYTF